MASLTIAEIAEDDGVDPSEVSSCDMIVELEERGFSVELDAPPTFTDEAFSALQSGNKERALELLRNYLCDVTGRILP